MRRKRDTIYIGSPNDGQHQTWKIGSTSRKEGRRKELGKGQPYPFDYHRAYETGDATVMIEEKVKAKFAQFAIKDNNSSEWFPTYFNGRNLFEEAVCYLDDLYDLYCVIPDLKSKQHSNEDYENDKKKNNVFGNPKYITRSKKITNKIHAHQMIFPL